mgnify:FL=1|tara:strand:+ start:1466 stop:2083 length:618 start_codon:yes stop_codon:yes gene_type:complete
MIKTYSSRSGRLSDTNKKFLAVKSKSLLNIGEKPKTKLPIVVDIGFGDAKSFSKDVVENDAYAFIGIEPYKKGFAKAVEFFEEKKPKNMYLFNGDAREFLLEAKYKIDLIRIHFPDPWPKKRHAKRRLITKKFLEISYNILKDNGSVEIITDSYSYQQHIEELIKNDSEFKLIKNFPISYEVSTYHRKALDKKHNIKEYILKKTS